MKTRSALITSFALSALLSIPVAAQKSNDAHEWLTRPDRSALFAEQPTALHFSTAANPAPIIHIHDQEKLQSIDGFGFALTGGSAQLLMKMDATKRAALLHQLFTTDGNGIGVSYLRISIGSSDMNDHVYSYDDVPAGQTDPDLKKFSIAPDRVDVIPVLKQILAIQPKIKILGSPWSAPAWMKTNDSSTGGSLKPEDYAVYAQYFVKYIQAMQAEGITLNTITIQNEPLNPKNTPSMAMFANEQDVFIRKYLGPAFQKAKIKTKILLYDHNPDVISYAESILRDPAASKYVDGTAFHLYGGEVSALTLVHNAFPKKNLYLTEQAIIERPNAKEMNIAGAVGKVLIGATQNWAKNVLLWNLAADPKDGPHTQGGCPVCQGAITLDGDKVTDNTAYYSVAHFSKFVCPGSVHVATNQMEQIPDVAFRTPDGRIVLVVANMSNFQKTFQVAYHGKRFASSLQPGDVATYVW